MITIKGNQYTNEEVERVFELVNELLEINETQNANLIAMNAKLENEEKKVHKLTQQLAQLSLMFTNNTYEA